MSKTYPQVIRNKASYIFYAQIRRVALLD